MTTQPCATVPLGTAHLDVPRRALRPRIRLSEVWSLLRFFVAGVTASASYGLVFLLLGAVTPANAHVLNVIATIASTLVANELHRRFSFRGASNASVSRGHGVGGVNAVVGLLLSTLALAGWHHLVPDAGNTSSVVVVYAVNAVVGLFNFLTLRHALGAR